MRGSRQYRWLGKDCCTGAFRGADSAPELAPGQLGEAQNAPREPDRGHWRAALRIGVVVCVGAFLGACGSREEAQEASDAQPVAAGEQAPQAASNPHADPHALPGSSENPHGGGAKPAEKSGPPAVGLSNIKQFTFGGRRTGEGYFSSDGRSIVFQSEREPGNPFYQIYWMDLSTGETRRVSPGVGKTTCAWIHPDGDRVLFASTHENPEARAQQQAEIDFRNSGEKRRYEWDYDPSYDLFAASLDGKQLTRLTSERGYDAEASYSPDGQWIVFSSNRHAYAGSLSDADRARFEEDPSSQLDLYLMRADGSDVRRLTDTLGYDGGPFFSADGARIIWRRFSLDGATAEIYSMKTDGTDVRQHTDMGVMSWAPYYHPSGDYAIFATNQLGFGNFELYAVATRGDGPSKPVRITDLDGFDGLPVFTPSGDRLAWTRRPGAGSVGSQIFMADWDDAAVRKALGIDGSWVARQSPEPDAAERAAALERVKQAVGRLTAPETEGRRTGTSGEQKATAYVAQVFEELGLEPAGSEGYFSPFEFTAGISLGPTNRLELLREGQDAMGFVVEQDWLPLSFSQVGEVAAADVVFAGYGIVAGDEEGGAPYDSYGEVSVKDRWVVAFRYLPEDIPAERRQELSRYASLRHKVMVARDRGARGILFVSGPLSQVKQQVVPLGYDGALAGASSVPSFSVSDAVAEALLEGSGTTLEAFQKSLAKGEAAPPLELGKLELRAVVDLEQEKRIGRNVIARLPAKSAGKTAAKALGAPILIGAHVDHLGKGAGSNSLARPDEADAVHPGADDNASGVAAMLEVARQLTQHPDRLGGRPVEFAAWSGEEMGLLGSADFVSQFPTPNPHADPEPAPYAAYLNMDMVGRLRDAMYVQGIGSSPVWPELVESANVPVGLPILLQKDSYLPTDATSFYLKGIPILSLFTGVHEQYHTPRDTPDLLDYSGIVRSARLVEGVATRLSAFEEAPTYVAMDRDARGPARVNLRAFLGTIPSYGKSDVVGLMLSGVAKNGPADKAGLQADDVIVELAGRKIENIYDYTYAMEALKVGQTVSIKVERGDQKLDLQITPESRD